MPTASRRSVLSQRSRTSKVLMSRFVRLTSRCVANAGVDAAVEHDAVELGARRQPDVHAIAEAHAIDVGLLDVGAHPEVVGVDQRDDRLPGVDDLAVARGAHVDDAVDRRGDLGVGSRTSALVRCAAAASCRCSFACTWLRRIADLLGVGARQRHCRAAARRPACAARRAWPARPRTSCAPGRAPAPRRPLARQVLGPLELEPRRFEVGTGGCLLRLGCGEGRLGLTDLLVDLPLLESKRRLGLGICDA